VFLAISTVLLNWYFIPKYGINGAAYASCIVIFLYNITKLLFVKAKFNMQPFTGNTLKTLGLIIYGFSVYKFNLSEDITGILNNLFNKKS